MTEAAPAGSAGSAPRDKAGAAAVASGPAEWLCLGATPAFAAMALLTGVPGGGPMAALCAPEHGSALDGMVPMYLLMSAFHALPWLKLLSRWRQDPPRHHDRAAAGAAR